VERVEKKVKVTKIVLVRNKNVFCIRLSFIYFSSNMKSILKDPRHTLFPSTTVVQVNAPLTKTTKSTPVYPSSQMIMSTISTSPTASVTSTNEDKVSNENCKKTLYISQLQNQFSFLKEKEIRDYLEKMNSQVTKITNRENSAFLAFENLNDAMTAQSFFSTLCNAFFSNEGKSAISLF